MSKLLDISIHGAQRVAIVERLVHLCRYDPGLILLEGEAGRSPVNFLRDMAYLLRDEMDFALLDGDCREVVDITSQLVDQWFIFKTPDEDQSDLQSVHHYLDLGLQSGRLALVVIERSSLLSEAAISFLIGMMARHSRLTVLFAGVIEARSLLRRAQQVEVPVHRIDLPDEGRCSLEDKPPVLNASVNLSTSHFDHKFSDNSYEAPELDEDELLCASIDIPLEERGRREPLMESRQEATLSSMRISASDSLFDVARRGADSPGWKAATMTAIQGKRPLGLLVAVGCTILVVLVLLLAEKSRPVLDKTNANPDAQPLVESTQVGVAATQGDQPSVSLPPAPVATEQLSSVQHIAGDKQTPIPVAVPDRAVDHDVADAPTAITPPSSGASPHGGIAGSSTAVTNSDHHQGSLKANTGSVSVDSAKAVGANANSSKASSAKAKSAKADSSRAVPGARSAALTEKQWKANPGNYTVQIAAAHSESNIRKLEASLPAGPPRFVHQTHRDGKPWFVLIYGSFTAKQEAFAAKRTLPPNIAVGTTPWIRKQGEVFAQ